MTFARARSDAYYILEAHDSGGTMFSVKGDGTLYADSGATFSGNLSLSEGKSLSHSGGTGDVVSNYFVRVDGNSWADIFQLQINSGSWSSATTQILFANTNINNGMVITTVEGYYSHSGNSSNEYTMGNVTFSENFQWVAVGSSPHRVKLQARSDQNGDSLSMLINIVTTCQAGQSLTITKIA